MTLAAPLAALSNDELFATVQRLTARSNVALADLLAHLGEVERRGLHRNRSCASLYTYCTYELRMSEDAAFRRSKAARFVREFPELRDAIAKGEIHLTGVLMIGPHLGGERHDEILRRARFRSKRELLRLIAEIDPKAPVPAVVEPLGPASSGVATHAAFAAALAGPLRELPEGQRPADWIDDSSDEMNGDDASDAAANDGAAPEPQRPLHYKVQFTASQEFVDLLNEARDLLGHEKPRPDVPDVQLRALRVLIEQLRKSKRAATDRPRAPKAAPTRGSDAANDTAPARDATRHVQAQVRREVWHRDGARCAYRDDRGERCHETSGLELHHCVAHARRGPGTAGNLELRCRVHNLLAAEHDFGRDHMDRMRGVHDDAAPARESPSA